jgi:hypothetical protein
MFEVPIEHCPFTSFVVHGPSDIYIFPPRKAHKDTNSKYPL